MLIKLELDIPELITSLRSTPVSEQRGLWDPNGNTLIGDSYVLVDDAFLLSIQDVRIFQPYRCHIARRDYVTFQFMQSSGTYFHSIGEHFRAVRSGSASLTAACTSVTESRSKHRPSAARGVAIHIARDHLVETFGLQPNFWREEYRLAFANTETTPFSVSTPLTPEMWMVLDAVIDCNFSDPVRTTYLKAKAIELLSLAVVKFNNLDLPGGTTNFSPQAMDQRRIDIAALIYRRELSCPPSINDMSRRVGINRNKLTSGFRQIFGRTPAEYSRDLRMEWAARRLSEGLSIRRVAAEAGYNSVAAFGRAFRQRHGYAPSEVTNDYQVGDL